MANHVCIHWIIEKERIPEKHLILLINYTKAFDCVDQNKLEKIFKRWEYQTT